MKLGLCPGSFDPITLGHLDIIRRACEIFDEVLVVTMVNAEKSCLFSPAERVDLIRRATAGLDRVSVAYSGELLAELARRKGDCVVVKGLRTASDFESEFQMSLINRRLNERLDTIFLPTAEEYLYLSSSLVKEVGSRGGDLSRFLPPEILPDVQKKLAGGI